MKPYCDDMFDFIATKDCGNYSVGIRANLCLLFAEEVAVPLDMQLVVFGHMAFCCADLHGHKAWDGGQIRLPPKNTSIVDFVICTSNSCLMYS